MSSLSREYEKEVVGYGEDRPGTKIAEQMMTRPDGATMDEIVAATAGRSTMCCDALKAAVIGFASKGRASNTLLREGAGNTIV